MLLLVVRPLHGSGEGGSIGLNGRGEKDENFVVALPVLSREIISLVRKRPQLKEAHVRLFAEDVETLEKIAVKNGTHWQIELRVLLRRTLRGEPVGITIIKE